MNRIAYALAGAIALAANVAIARPEKWVFAKNSFAEDDEVAYVSNVVARAKAADNVYAATGSLKWLLSLDEIRNECQCELCLKRKEDIAHKMGAHITELVDTILDRYPAADLYAWCDMLNPYDNPKQKRYYNCLTTWQGVWDLIPGPDRLKMVYWGEKPKLDEVDFFAKRGYRGIAAGYYDYDPELRHPAKWVEAMNDRPGAFDGWMYTTWEQKHDQIEDFAKIMDDGWKKSGIYRFPERGVEWLSPEKDFSGDKPRHGVSRSSSRSPS